jgi:hypothetical protein
MVLCGCATKPATWARVDGASLNPVQLQADRTGCAGEAEKANMAAGNNAAEMTNIFGYSGPMQSVYDGCMAQHGYLKTSGDR